MRKAGWAMKSSIKQKLKKGWSLAYKKKDKKAHILFIEAHSLAGPYPVLHSLSHFSLAYISRHKPKKLCKEIYLGICAPFASIRSNIHTFRERAS